MFINILNGLLVLNIGMNGLSLALWSTLIIDISIEFLFATLLVFVALGLCTRLCDRKEVR